MKNLKLIMAVGTLVAPSIIYEYVFEKKRQISSYSFHVNEAFI